MLINKYNRESALDFMKETAWLKKFLLGHNGYIAGGCFKNIFSGEDVKDIDIFFRNKDDFLEAEALFEKRTFGGQVTLVYENDNAVAYKMDGIVVELIKKQFGTPEEMIKNFDFTIAKFAFYHENLEDLIIGEQAESESEEENGKIGYYFTEDASLVKDSEKDKEYFVTYHKDFFKHLTLKRVVVENEDLDFPLNTFDRILRYKGYGYSPCTGTKIKMAKMINSMELPENEEDMFKGLYNGIDWILKDVSSYKKNNVLFVTAASKLLPDFNSTIY